MLKLVIILGVLLFIALLKKNQDLKKSLKRVQSININLIDNMTREKSKSKEIENTLELFQRIAQKDISVLEETKQIKYILSRGNIIKYSDIISNDFLFDKYNTSEVMNIGLIIKIGEKIYNIPKKLLVDVDVDFLMDLLTIKGVR